jgi:hypothetical protein
MVGGGEMRGIGYYDAARERTFARRDASRSPSKETT